MPTPPPVDLSTGISGRMHSFPTPPRAQAIGIAGLVSSSHWGSQLATSRNIFAAGAAKNWNVTPFLVAQASLHVAYGVVDIVETLENDT